MARGTYSLVTSKILNVLVVILVQVLMSFTYPSSNEFRFDQRYPRCNYLDGATNKAISNQYSKKATRHGKAKNTEGKGLALVVDVRSLGQKEAEVVIY